LLTTRPFLLFGPLLRDLLGVITARARYGSIPGLLIIGLALLTWTLLEWTVHRAMHWQTRCQMLSRFQDRAHLRHHRAPHDLPHAVLKLSASIPLAGVCFLAAWLGWRDLDRTFYFQAGLLAGYLWYESVHLLAHWQRCPLRLRSLRRYHRQHHFDTSTRTYGVTSPFWDWVFGTLPTGTSSQ
jgi:sterol desaturase/sphingolipid hydroxylase (fatty acid hydroxylase superfamily)